MGIIKIKMFVFALWVGVCFAQFPELSWLDQYKFSTTHITYRDTIAQGMRKSTGFIAYGYKSDSLNYLVFNRHFIRNTLHLDIKIPLRLLLQSGKIIMSTAVQRVFLYDSNGNRLWKALPDTLVDIAVLEIPKSWKIATPGENVVDRQCRQLPKSIFADMGEIYEGAFVYFTGYPLGLAGRISPYPITRFGIIASVHGEEILGRKLIIVDGSGFPGGSGSPVFLSPFNMAKDTISFGGGKKLVGIQVGFKDMRPVVDSVAVIKNRKNATQDTVEITFRTNENSHLMVVAPAYLIKKTLALFDPEWSD
jgi:hypothetical protein